MNIGKRAVVKALGGSLRPWVGRCHEASLKLVRSGILPRSARVARGFHPAFSQHSWVVIGDPYSFKSMIVDPTIWHYEGKAPQVYVKTMKNSPHRPHGLGQFDRTPPEPESDAIRLMTDLSPEATRFLKTIAPKGLDRYGWHMIATAPVLGWPSAEILAAIAKDERLSVLVPIDVLGMRTDLNPGRLYR